MNSEGEIELQLISAAYPIYRKFLAGMRQSRHGMAFFWNEASWLYEGREGILAVTKRTKAECVLTIHGLPPW